MSGKIDQAACRRRQARLLEKMAELRLDRVIVTRPEHVQWLTGARFDWKNEPCAALDQDGRLTLVAPRGLAADAAADDVLPYDAHFLFTQRMDQSAEACQTLLTALAGPPAPRRVGVERGAAPQCLIQQLTGEIVEIDHVVHQLRRRKEPDELAMIKTAIAATGAMLSRAREIVEPGVNELDVFSELQAAAVRHCGEMLTGTGNDYACGVSGGPPRDRRSEAGELYILDLGPAYRGYFADVTRVLAVDRRPTDRQQQACNHVRAVFEMVERSLRAGVRCRDLFAEVGEHLLSFPGGQWEAHLGHGMGLFPHEPPRINPHWDDTFEAGDVIAVEPAVYAADLRAGVRLENDYLVTESGVELLSDFSYVMA